MADKVNMSLDELVKMNKQTRGGGRGRGARGRGGRGGIGLRRGGGGGGIGRGGLGGIRKRRSGGPNTSPFKAAAKVPDGKWLHDMYGGQGGLRRAPGGLSSGPTKIIISNLDYGVNDKDIKDLFQDFGAIRKAAVHYDRSGRSLGTADVLFEKRQDAIRAMKKYNGVQLDGRPMDIKLATDTASAAPVFQRNGNSAGGLQRGGFRGGRGGRGGGFRGGRGGRGGGGRQNNKPAKTQAELDADLDTYNKMQTD